MRGLMNGGKTFEFKAVAGGLRHHEPAYYQITACVKSKQNYK